MPYSARIIAHYAVRRCKIRTPHRDTQVSPPNEVYHVQFCTRPRIKMDKNLGQKRKVSGISAKQAPQSKKQQDRPIHHYFAKETKQIKDSDGKHAEAEPDTEAKYDQDSPDFLPKTSP